MKIAISAHATRGLRSGLGHYLRNILREFLIHFPDIEFIVYCREDEKEAFEFADLDRQASFRLGGPKHAGAAYDIWWHNTKLPKLVHEEGADVLFVAVDRRIPFRCSIPVVSTVHDLAAFTVGDKYPLSRRVYCKQVLPRLIRRLDAVVTISESTLLDVEKHIGIPSERMTMVHHGVDHERFGNVDEKQIPAVLEKLKIKAPYILYAARLEHPGKNHVGLLEALAASQSEEGQALSLVFAGSPWRNEEVILDRIKELGLSDRVVVTGFVDDADLPILYAGAQLFFFPSLYEGFGMPLLEAMAAGTPMAVGRTSSLPEVAGEAALYFDPNQPESIRSALDELAVDPNKRAQLSQLGRERVKQFTWERAAKRTMEALQKAAGQ